MMDNDDDDDLSFRCFLLSPLLFVPWNSNSIVSKFLSSLASSQILTHLLPMENLRTFCAPVALCSPLE